MALTEGRVGGAPRGHLEGKNSKAKELGKNGGEGFVVTSKLGW